jgi:phosphoribosylformylglycinamidine (FGAM) synthase-like amidotransferase family enzyme
MPVSKKALEDVALSEEEYQLIVQRLGREPNLVELGMMPHPERCCEAILGGDDGRLIFESILGV